MQKGALKYIETDVSIGDKLDEDKIRNEARWDGYYGIETNCDHFSNEKILSAYHDLWRVEESFRIFKSHLEARPVFHWTPKRIKGHFVLCFIAFLLERTLEVKLKERKVEYSPMKVRDALNGLQYSVIDVDGRRIYVSSRVEGLANEVMRALRMQLPPGASEGGSYTT